MAVLLAVMATAASAAVIIGVFTRRVGSPGEVQAWAAAHGVTLTDGNRPMATYWVRLLVTLRVVGGTAGLVLSWLFDAVTGLDTGDGGGWLVWVVLGWVAGSLWAESCLDRPDGRAATASLAPRRVADYLPRSLRMAPIVAAGVVVTLAVAAALAPAPDTPSWPLPSDGLLLSSALGAVALGVAEACWTRVIVARRQPVADAEVVAVDEAVRANVLHHLAGGVTAALLLLGVEVAIAVLEPRSLPLGLGTWLPVALFLSALVVWRWSAHRAWRVRRPLPGRPVPAP